jgi:hypothetical protein
MRVRELSQAINLELGPLTAAKLVDEIAGADRFATDANPRAPHLATPARAPSRPRNTAIPINLLT